MIDIKKFIVALILTIKQAILPYMKTYEITLNYMLCEVPKVSVT